MTPRENVRIHATAEVSDQAEIGPGTRIWNHCQVREGARLGANCILSKDVYVDAGVQIGNNVKLQNGISVYHGVTLEDGVFCGPHMVFTNDRQPRAINPDGSLKAATDWVLSETRVRTGASIGAGAIIVCGITIGRWALIGAGAVVTRDVPDYGLVYGNPGRLRGFVSPYGHKMTTKRSGGADPRRRFRPTHGERLTAAHSHPPQEARMIPISKPFIGDAEKQAVMEVLDSGMLVQGPRVAKLEEKFAALCGTRHAIATSNGTTALHLALLANGVGAGDEVITVAFTFMATVSTILMTGARPVFVDVDPETFNLNPDLIEAAITPRTKAILLVHLYGHPCEMDRIMAIAARHNLRVIEDACQAVGAAFRGQVTGSFGTGTFSLYATKNIMTGEGGMITTNDDALAEACRLMRQHGMKRRYYHDMLGYNYRMTDLHAAIGVAQMDRLADFTAKRRANAEYLNAKIESVVTPRVRPGHEHVWHQYTIRVDGGRDRDAAVKQLADNGVGSGVFYPVPAHQQGYVRELVGPVSLPVTEQLAREVISLPVHPALSQADLEKIVLEVNRL